MNWYKLPIRLRLWVAVLLAILLVGCTSYVPRKELPLPLLCDNCSEKVKIVTVPLPVIASSPNEGITYGALAAFQIHDKNDEINTMLAPQLGHR